MVDGAFKSKETFKEGAGFYAAAPTGATQGTPGSFTPGSGKVPNSLTELRALGAIGQTGAWTGGNYVLLGDGSRARWDGDSWEVAP